MKIPLLLLVVALFATDPLPLVHAQAANTTPSAGGTLSEFEKLIGDAKSELAKTENEAKAAADKLGKATQETRQAAQEELNAAEGKVNASRQKVTALEQGYTVLRQQGPVGLLIGDLKKERDALSISGTEEQKSRRAELSRKISILETAETALESTNGPMKRSDAQTDLGPTGVFAIILVVILLAALLFGLGYLWIKASHNSKAESGDDAVARVRLAKAVTLGAMTFIVLVSVVTLLCAGINAAVPPQNEKKTALFFDIAKWVLATVLPVVAAWVSGVMAYYFGKDNFKAGAENAETIIKQLTPQQKLASKKASASGLAIGDATVSRVAQGGKLEDEKLDKLRTDFKSFERLPILDDKGCPLACLHLSTLTKYTDSLSAADKNDPTKMTLGVLIQKLSWDPAASFAAVKPDSDLSHAQALMNASKECSDVFVTADGSKLKPVDRWITNEDIMKVATA